MTAAPRPGHAPIAPSGPILGVDLGDVRTGLAVTDPDQLVATPLDTVDVADLDDDQIVERLATVAVGRAVVGVVVGLPRRLDGREGAAARRARRIASGLGQATQLVVDLWDERFTTTEAERVMIEQGARREQRRQAVDRVAATFILQSYLEARRTRRPNP